MAFSLETLLEDGRLARLFHAGERACALQLWILQIKADAALENRVLYGRLLPYNYASSAWSGTDDDHFKEIGVHRAQIIQLNLYFKSTDATSLLKHLSAGETLVRTSEALDFSLHPTLAARVGNVTLGGPPLVRAVAYLLNRDAMCLDELASPHGAAGAFSAALSQADKRALLRLGEQFDVDLAKLIVEELSAATGLDFASRDSERLGDLELLVFPTLDDSERNLLNLQIERSSYRVQLDPSQLPHYARFAIRLHLMNGRELVHSIMAIVERLDNGTIESAFEVPDLLSPIADGIEIEIHGSGSGEAQGVLCCRWRGRYMRELIINTRLVGQEQPSVRLSWLERVTRSSKAAGRLQAAQTVNQGRHGSSSRVGDRQADPWIPVNRDVASLFERLHPPRSEGRFFERLSENDLGRLEFVEWIKSQLMKHGHHEVVLFDPYFEDAGVALIVLNATKDSRYVVYTNLPKPSGADARIGNLLRTCEQLRPLMRNVSFKVYGLKPEALHDRYLLFIDSEGVPAAGFHLSNSIQKANENYPLLITPIPQDVLQRVFRYSSELLAEAFIPPDGGGKPKTQLIFDSKAAKPTLAKRFERLAFLNADRVGDVLADWTGEAALRGLSGVLLRERMRSLGLLKEETLALSDTPGLKGCIDHQGGQFDDFSTAWQVVGEILAHTPTGDALREEELSSRDAFLGFLAHFLWDSFGRVASGAPEVPVSHVPSTYFAKTTEEFLRAAYRPDQFFHPVKYAALSWAEYFAIKILWIHDPNTLITMAEQQATTATLEDREGHTVRLSLLSQIASEAALGAQFGMSDAQRDRLISSSMGLLKWLGLNVLESRLTTTEGANAVIQYTSSFSRHDRVRVLGWMANHLATRPPNDTAFRALVEALLAVFPSRLGAADVKELVDSLLCRHRRLGQCEPWLFQEFIHPLLEDERADINELCRIWTDELLSYFDDSPGGRAGLFQREAEGCVTERAAYLFALSSPEQQVAACTKLSHALAKARRAVQRPLASTLNWTVWDRSLVVTLWIFAFTRWAGHFLAKIGKGSPKLEEVATEARRVAFTRPMAEWHVHGGLGNGRLIQFVEELGAI
jgi:hypothetical protein